MTNDPTRRKELLVLRQPYAAVTEEHALKTIVAVDRLEESGAATAADRRDRKKALEALSAARRTPRIREKVKSSPVTIDYSGLMDPRSTWDACRIVALMFVLAFVSFILLVLLVSVVHNMMT